jgi:DNA-binding Xre family transcriptional regulator
MKVKIQIKEVFKKYGLYKRGVIMDLAECLGINRQTAGKLLAGEVNTVSLDVLSNLCNWLSGHGVSPDILPGELFSRIHSGLWSSLAKSGQCTFILGEGFEEKGSDVVWRWLSRRDVMALSIFVQQLSMRADFTAPGIRFQYVPFNYAPKTYDPKEEPLSGDIANSEQVFRFMQSDSTHSYILIGSQRVLYTLEHFIADLFGVTPFLPIVGEAPIPFYSVYRRDGDYPILSCFGGRERPDGRNDATLSGLHYKIHDIWEICQWRKRIQGDYVVVDDAAVVIVKNDHQTGAVKMAVFGYGGLATQQIAKEIVSQESKFWPPPYESTNFDLGINICKMVIALKNPGKTSEEVTTRKCDIIPLNEKTLKERL